MEENKTTVETENTQEVETKVTDTKETKPVTEVKKPNTKKILLICGIALLAVAIIAGAIVWIVLANQNKPEPEAEEPVAEEPEVTE